MVAHRYAKLLLLMLLLSACALADNIRLKNGTSISADKVTEKGDQVEYFVGATAYSIPRASVDRIERSGSFGISVGKPAPGVAYRDPSFSRGDAAPEAPSSKARGKLAGAPPSTAPIGSADRNDLRAQIINLGRVDSRALNHIEEEKKPDKSAAAYFEAARFELERNDYDAARKYVKQSLSFAPNEPSLIGFYVYLLMQAGQYPEAIHNAEHAAQLAPNSSDTMRLLGLAYYNAGRLSDAIRAWERAQQIQPSDAVQQYLTKAQREARVEDTFAELQSPHFSLRFEGRQPGFTLRSDLLRTLERQYSELSRDLGFAPPQNITVVLYTEKQFFDVTEAPSWAGGLNDGKLRIPVGSVSDIAPIDHVLKHELTHSFIHSITRGQCPRWLNEGLAMIMEPKSSAPYGQALARLFAAGKQAPLASLEGSFTKFSSEQATLAYAESLAATEYLRSNYGMRAVQRMLQLISDGESGEAALRAATRSGYQQFEKDLGAYLAKSGTP